ncbi:hypothetical protein [Paenibacillus sp. TH7-28]
MNKIYISIYDNDNQYQLLSLEATGIIELYAARFKIECTFGR